MNDTSVKIDPLEAAKTWLVSMPGKGPEFEDVAADLAALLRHFIFCGECAMREEIALAFENLDTDGSPGFSPSEWRQLLEGAAKFARAVPTPTQKAAH